MEALTTKKYVDRLLVLVSELSINWLLKVSKLAFGTDKAQPISLDTTATNTEHQNGTCILLEQTLGKDILCLACCHRIAELFLATENSLLKQFKGQKH